MSDLSQLIEIAKNIERQNGEIIRLLKKMAGENDEDEKFEQYKKMLSYSPDMGQLLMQDSNPKKEEPAENKYKIGSLLAGPHKTGEVCFMEDGEIYRLSLINSEIQIDSLTGEDNPDDFELQQMIAELCLEKNTPLEDGTVILSLEQSQNLPDTLKICLQQDAKNVYMPNTTATQLVGAPDTLMRMLNLKFYRSQEHLLEMLFG